MLGRRGEPHLYSPTSPSCLRMRRTTCRAPGTSPCMAQQRRTGRLLGSGCCLQLLLFVGQKVRRSRHSRVAAEDELPFLLFTQSDFQCKMEGQGVPQQNGNNSGVAAEHVCFPSSGSFTVTARVTATA